MTDTTQTATPVAGATSATQPAGSVASDIALATDTAALGAAASGNVALVPDIAAAGQLATLLTSSIALAQSGHISASGWAGIQTAFAEAVAHWKAA